MNNITIGEIVGAIAIVTSFVAFYKLITTPVKDYIKRLNAVEEHLNNDNIRLKTLETDTRMILKATRVLIAHSVDNNHTGELKNTQQEIDEYLINK